MDVYFTFGFFLAIWIMVDWFRVIVLESTYMGYHTERVQFSHKTGIKLFITSEVMFFFHFFGHFLPQVYLLLYGFSSNIHQKVLM